VDLHLENKFDARVEVSCVDPLEGVYKAAHRHYFIHIRIAHRKESLCYNYG
jgi:hypothetical protein